MTDKPRSLPQHKRFFALVRACYHHWPEKHPFHPDCEEHMRAYLLVKAGYRSIKTFLMSDEHVASEAAHLLPIVAALSLERHCWSWTDGNSVYVAAPESIAFDKLPHAKACAVMTAVEDYLHSIGIDPDQILRETEAAA